MIRLTLKRDLGLIGSQLEISGGRRGVTVFLHSIKAFVGNKTLQPFAHSPHVM